MTPKGTPDPEYPTSNSRKGDRKDKKNLIDVWLKAKPVGLFNVSVGYNCIFSREILILILLACLSEQKVTLCLEQEGF